MKLNFFSRIYLAITDFRLYPFIAQKEKFISAFAYFLCFIILISGILATGAIVRIVNWGNEFLTIYDKKINEFTIQDGILDVSENMDFEFSGVKIYSDDSKLYEEMDFETYDLEDNRYSFVALKDAFAIGSSNIGFLIAKYDDLGIEIDNVKLYELLSAYLENPISRISLASGIFCGVFFVYLCTKFLNIIGITLMLLFLGLIFRMRYKFRDYIKVACYVITLPIITEIIGIMVTGQITDYAYITYYLLIYVYMYYAIRALKLDNIIMATQEKLGIKMNFQDKTSESEEKKEDEEKKDEEK